MLHTLSISRLTSDEQRQVRLPSSARLGFIGWSPDSSRFAFTVSVIDAIQLWVLNISTGQAAQVRGIRLSAVLG
ncbi:MAG: hypothetical protein ACKPJJ_12915, partial [Planctomycetaceae bacterium]